MNPAQACGEVLVDELVRLGVRHVVLAPGSRSAPLAYAAYAADRAGRLTLHVRVDERSAAFVALGLAKLTGVPAAVVTTSGTAVANLHPAVLEAHESGVPLLLLTADRPPELRGTRANQTTDQVGLFGAAVRWSHDLGCPARRPGQVAAWRAALDRAYAAAAGALASTPGPAHLNVPLRDPLVPDPPGTGPPWPESLAGRPGGRPWTRVPPGPPPAAADPGAPAGPDSLQDVARTLVVLGDAPAADLARAAQAAARLGYPVVSEPFGRRDADPRAVLPHGSLVLAAGLAEPGGAGRVPPRPERILVVGRPTLTRAVAGLLRTVQVPIEVVSTQPRWPDPGLLAERVHDAGALARLAARVPAAAGPGADGRARGFREAWAAAAGAVAGAVGPALSRSWPSGPALAAAVLAALPPQAVLFLGSSNAARDVDVARAADGAEVVASRGLAGIDGCVSTAAGIALAAPERPVYALLGDLTLLHDANGLLVGPAEPRVDLTVVVGNDDGGGIFGTLEYGEPERLAADPDAFDRLFGTPTGARIADLCSAHGARHVPARAPHDLAAAVAMRPQGLTVVEVPLPRGRARHAYAQLTDVARRALRGG